MLGLVEDTRIVDNSCSSGSLGLAGTKRLSKMDYEPIAALQISQVSLYQEEHSL